MRRFLLLIFGVALLACRQPTGPERELSGGRLYEQYCARCHGPDGEGMPDQPGADRLADRAYMSTLSDAQIERAIRMGRPPRMPAFGDRFTAAALQVLVAHVRELSQSRGPDVRARDAR